MTHLRTGAAAGGARRRGLGITGSSGSRARASGPVVDGGVAADACRRGFVITGSSGSRARAGRAQVLGSDAVSGSFNIPARGCSTSKDTHFANLVVCCWHNWQQWGFGGRRRFEVYICAQVRLDGSPARARGYPSVRISSSRWRAIRRLCLLSPTRPPHGDRTRRQVEVSMSKGFRRQLCD